MIKQLIVTFLLLTTMISVNAQSKEETAVGNAVEQLRKAMIDGNKAELEAIASDKLSYGHSSGYVEGKTEFVDKIATGKSDFVTIELKDQTISVNGKVAVVRHKLNATTNDNGKPGEVHLAILLVFQKENKQWKLLARQAVKVAQ
ncbi:nuclear transport factor 2 family protein [Terrimonas pollutisoli]|uniref:nuclear transport factor 2 family protein n=1 Tax=Terrimonas pollutisoli TaxID=3034147 RepID=UPI0023ECD65B|nr:nuclear transport factor 2 family protein [Terrimonas sp. H1YJ31]